MLKDLNFVSCNSFLKLDAVLQFRMRYEQSHAACLHVRKNSLGGF